MKPGRLVALAAFSLPAALARAQGPPCPEFRANTYTTDVQYVSDVASDPAGNFVVLWGDGGRAGYNLIGRLFHPSGTPQGPEFLINADTTRPQNTARAAFDASGSFVVAWNGPVDGSSFGVLARRFDAAGVPLGPEFPVNTFTTGFQSNADVAAHSSGSFVVVWESEEQDGDGQGIFAQRFDAAGAPLGPEFQVNTYTFDHQRFPAVAMDGMGRFVVVWSSWSHGQDDLLAVVGQRFDAQGVRQGPEFRVNTYTTHEQGELPAIADASGNVIVIWTSRDQDGDSYGVYGQRYDAAGAAVGPEFRVNDHTTGSQVSSSVAVGADGDFLATWTQTSPGAIEQKVYARRFSAAGVPRGPGFLVSTTTAGDQRHPSVSATNGGGFVVAWASNPQGGSDRDVYASADCVSRLYTVSPCRLADTREPPGLPLGANSSRSFAVSGACNIPADARTVVLNVTAVNPTDLGNLRIYPAGLPLPNASTLNFAAGRTRANNAIVPLGTDGRISVQCDMPPGSPGTTHLVLDVFGYFRR